jgi:hypothetical protein
MRITLTTYLRCPPAWAWEQVQTPRLLTHIAWPLVRFTPLDPPAWPQIWAEQPYLAGLLLFGVVPIGTQSLDITILSGQPPYLLRDNGRGDLIRRWDHLITIEEAAGGKTRYTDQVDIEAGYRQWRWRQLVRSRAADIADRRVR